MRAFLFTVLTLIAMPFGLRGEGSCSWEDVLPILKQNPTIQTFVESKLEVEDVGIALRMGRHYVNFGGRRVAPYTFRAKPKGEGGPFQFQLVILAESQFFDENGQQIALEAADDVLEAKTLNEVFTGIRIEPLVGEDDELSAEDAEALVKKIREQFNEINMADHNITAIEFADEEMPIDAKAVYHRNPKNSSLQLITIDGALGDHSGFSESFYFWEGKLIFIFRSESHWTFHPQNPNQTIDTINEQRFYFADGKIFRALAKKYEGGGPELLKKAAADAPNQPIILNGDEASKFFSRASRLLISRTPKDLIEIYKTAFD